MCAHHTCYNDYKSYAKTSFYWSHCCKLQWMNHSLSSRKNRCRWLDFDTEISIVDLVLFFHSYCVRVCSSSEFNSSIHWIADVEYPNEFHGFFSLAHIDVDFLSGNRVRIFVQWFIKYWIFKYITDVIQDLNRSFDSIR